jgi:soluble lytic murein transglycosylase-like protein
MSVRSHREEDRSIVLVLRRGGEMVVEPALIAAIGPDEVPYPEPEVAQVASDDPSSDASANAADPTLRRSEDPTRRTWTGQATVNSAFDALIRRLAAEKGVDASIVRAVIQVESGYQPRARSVKGAVGLMQVMPSTARQYGITNLYDPSSNIRAGVTHLKTLLDRFPLALALAAYNAGEAAVERFAGIPPYPETVDYVARVRALAGR